MGTVNKQLTPEKVEGLKQFETERKERIKRVLSKYSEINGKLVKTKPNEKTNIHSAKRK